jgi:hypothetical protein
MMPFFTLAPLYSRYNPNRSTEACTLRRYLTSEKALGQEALGTAVAHG